MLTLLYHGVMTTKQAIKLAGNATALAALLGITKSAVSHWGKSIPPLRLHQLREVKPEWFAAKEAA